MARISRALSPGVMATATTSLESHVERGQQGEGETGRCTADDEPICETWHDSSWMLRKGLEVIEELDPEPAQPGSTPAWHTPQASDLGCPMSRSAELG